MRNHTTRKALGLAAVVMLVGGACGTRPPPPAVSNDFLADHSQETAPPLESSATDTALASSLSPPSCLEMRSGCPEPDPDAPSVAQTLVMDDCEAVAAWAPNARPPRLNKTPDGRSERCAVEHPDWSDGDAPEGGGVASLTAWPGTERVYVHALYPPPGLDLESVNYHQFLQHGGIDISMTATVDAEPSSWPIAGDPDEPAGGYEVLEISNRRVTVQYTGRAYLVRWLDKSPTGWDGYTVAANDGGTALTVARRLLTQNQAQ